MGTRITCAAEDADAIGAPQSLHIPQVFQLSTTSCRHDLRAYDTHKLLSRKT